MLKDFHGREFFAFEEFQKGAARSGNIRHFVVDAVFLNRGNGVAAACQSEGAGFGDRFGDGLGTFAELVELEHADRAVPHYCARFHDDVGEFLRRSWADVENHVVVSHIFGILQYRRFVGIKSLADHYIHRDGDMGAALFHFFNQRLRGRN